MITCQTTGRLYRCSQSNKQPSCSAGRNQFENRPTTYAILAAQSSLTAEGEPIRSFIETDDANHAFLYGDVRVRGGDQVF